MTLNVSGIDDNSARYLHARRLYNHKDIHWNYRYRDITSFSERGARASDRQLDRRDHAAIALDAGLTRDEARRIAANIAKLPELLSK